MPGKGAKKVPARARLARDIRDTISVLRSGRFIAAIALVAYSIAGSRKRRTLARTSGGDCCMLSAINGRYYHVAKPVSGSGSGSPLPAL